MENVELAECHRILESQGREGRKSESRRGRGRGVREGEGEGERVREGEGEGGKWRRKKKERREGGSVSICYIHSTQAHVHTPTHQVGQDGVEAKVVS